MPCLIIIDDMPETVRGVEALGERYGWDVIGFVRAADAIAAYIATPDAFDCIVTDIYMPDMDGIELIREMRKLDPAVPIIAVTGGSSIHANRELSLRMARQLGADAVLPKPYSGAELFGLAASLLAGRPDAAASPAHGD